MTEALPAWPLTHAGIKPILHPRLEAEINAQTVVRYLRFLRPVEIERLELPLAHRPGRWVPAVPSHPAHLLVSVQEGAAWQVVREVEFPPDPRLAGEGLTQSMSIAEMDAHFARLEQEPPRVIDLGGLRTDHLRVECDREHPVWPNHGECNGGEYHVPFALLNPLTAHGRPLQEDFYRPTYRPLLERGAVEPTAPAGMTVAERPEMLLFSGDQLSVGFSLRRPLLVHLGWDAHGQGLAGRQRLAFAKRPGWVESAGGVSGPLLRTLTADLGAHLWTGTVEVRGNRVSYRNLHAADGLTLDAIFTVEPDRLGLELIQTCAADLPALEAEAWRLLFDLSQGLTGCAGRPTLRPGRNGEVALPAVWATDSVGCLTCAAWEHEGGAPRLQVESYRDLRALSGGVVLGPEEPPEGGVTLPAGTQRAVVELTVTRLEPVGRSVALAPGAASRWAAIFSCFRPEYGGFSNNSASVNCHLSQGAPMDLIAHTRRPDRGPDPVDLGRFTLERALLDGGGYGYWRNLYLDSDPNLICAVGRLHQVRPDVPWLQRIAPGLREATDRLLATLGEQGLAVCQDLSGNSGSHRWSSNGMDVVGFGYLDAYVNAWTYRALRNAGPLWRDLGDRALAARCAQAADRLRAAFAPALVNPATGWVAGWRSRDGELHDYAFLFVNGPALAWGLLDD